MKPLKIEINRLQNNEKQLNEMQLQLTRLQEENNTLSMQVLFI